MKIGELSKRSGLSAFTIRYYEKIGLLPKPKRDASRQRDYDSAILAWIDFLNRLKTTGMPIRDMLRYAKLREKGDVTNAERQEILTRHREKLAARIEELNANLVVIDVKIDGYAKTTGKGKKHARN